ncbi:Transcriptional regulator [Mitosporidium daphniae]|uniref:Subunit Ngg1 of chromatin-remodeling complex n=1 Tax=Mitosporidium daphniae TaxID=1485682 RepID=A0A098VQE1_9MICR|nr:subunit Ngg1 of chromatin-remodeling complex [Mitosporidium daphniae]KGG51200.1 subunit Ngg1 of chromatin-remodeling complex [Mitosporidium daphniae]|eukprot:XP_013237627.1 subunit Ngg1 of chromatin-remodeling complex [Mitosporidium daphniae]
MHEEEHHDGSPPDFFIKLPQLEEHAPSLDRLFGDGIDHQISAPLSSIRDELIVLKVQLKAMVGQLLVQLRKLRPTALPNAFESTLYEEIFFKSEFPLRIVCGEQDDLGTLTVGNSGSGHKRLFKSRPSSQSRQRNSNLQSKQPISAVSPSAFWSFIENSGYFKEIGEEELTWLETNEKSLAAVGGGIPPLGDQEAKESSNVPPNYLVERLLSSLMEESKGSDNVNLLSANSTSAPTPRFATTNNIIMHRRKKPWEGLCERILWDLRSIGICGPIITDEEASNEICAALRKCQSELALITKKNEERKKRLYELLVGENYLSALEYYRVLDDLNRGIEGAYSRRLASSPDSPSAASATAALVSVLNKKALLMRAFNGSNFPKRSQMAKPLGFASDKGNHPHLSLLQRIAGGSHTSLARLLTSPSIGNQMQVDSTNQASKVEKRRKKKL